MSDFMADATPAQPTEHVWTDQAVAGLIGQQPTVEGQPGEVTDAWKDDAGGVFIRIRVNADPAPFTLDGLSISADFED